MNIKNILLIGAIAATSSLTALAQNAETGRPYVKAHVGLTKAQNIVDVNPFRYKSNPTIMGAIALGYNIKNNLRADIGLDYYPHLKFSTDNSNAKIDAKLKTSSLLVNFYMDVAEINRYKFFVGAGAGLSRFSVKVQVTDKISNQTFPIKYVERDIFAYGLYAGTHYEYAPGIHGELVYAYKDLGTIGTSKLKLHNITTGIRFDL